MFLVPTFLQYNMSFGSGHHVACKRPENSMCNTMLALQPLVIKNVGPSPPLGNFRESTM